MKYFRNFISSSQNITEQVIYQKDLASIFVGNCPKKIEFKNSFKVSRDWFISGPVASSKVVFIVEFTTNGHW